VRSIVLPVYSASRTRPINAARAIDTAIGIRDDVAYRSRARGAGVVLDVAGNVQCERMASRRVEIFGHRRAQRIAMVESTAPFQRSEATVHADRLDDVAETSLRQTHATGGRFLSAPRRNVTKG
jgi:hypothetical protein